mgnify:CR=1 FL=1
MKLAFLFILSLFMACSKNGDSSKAGGSSKTLDAEPEVSFAEELNQVKGRTF